MTNKLKIYKYELLDRHRRPSRFDFDLDEALDFKNIRTLEIKQR